MAVRPPTSYSQRSPKDFIRGWLMRNPKPHRVRVTCADGVREIALSTVGETWAQRANTIWQLDPTLLECLSEANEVIRATRFDDVEEEPDDDAAPATPAAAAPIVVTANDPETARFELFARLLVQSIKDATSSTVEGYKVAFQQLIELANVHAKRGESLEKSLATTERMLRDAWRQNIELEAEVQEKQDPLTEIVEAFAGGRQAGEAAAAAEHPTNGKA